MKKLLPLFLAAALLLSACNSENEAPENSENEKITYQTTTGETAGAPVSTDVPVISDAPVSDIGQGIPTATDNTTSKSEEKPVSVEFSANPTEKEGKPQTSDFNYGEALQKSILFYDLQRSGDLPDNFRCNWRGDSCLKDGSDVGLDLSGGFYDAGDNVKFNLPMSYTTAVLAWSVIEDRVAYEQSGQLKYILDNIRWGNDYFIKCHPEPNVYYYQVGDGNADHGWWGAAECVDVRMNRPSYKVDLNNGGSTVAAGTAASLATCAIVFKDSDPEYSKLCLKHAKELYSYAETVKSDSGYTAANGFYNSHSGYNDELAFAGYWLYKATGEKSYLDKCKSYYSLSGNDYKWALCWDDKGMGTTLLLARETGEKVYKDKLEQHLNYWNGELKHTPKGLAWLDQWGALRYATTTAFLAAVYSDSDICPSDKKATYQSFAKKQIDYALGSSGRSFVCGFGENPPVNPHHRTAHGSATDNIGEPSVNAHILYGALVGGPDSNDGYSDDRSNYVNNEVACDYNAGFTGALAKLYKAYGGETLKNFGAVEGEPQSPQLYADAGINVNGQDFIEIKALVYNKSTTPAHNANNLKLCYFFDLSEVYEAGGSYKDITVSTNYMQGGSVSGVNCWNSEKNLYYVAIDFTGVDIYPGGQDAHKKEVQFRIRNEKGVWDNSNDPSYIDVASVSPGNLTKANNMALYEGNTLVFGKEPDETNTGTAISELISKPTNNNGSNNNNNNNNGNNNSGGGQTAPVSDKGTVSVSLSQQATSGNANTIAFTLEIKNTGSTGIDLGKLTADYFFTKDGATDLCFWCDYADISGSSYTACTDSISGSFSSSKGDNRDTKCTIKGSGVLSGGDTLKINVRITKSDWSEFNLSNDYSTGNAGNITITYNGKEL